MHNKITLPTGTGTTRTYLSDILSLLPANKIIFKDETGCGATTAEILALRHSILIEPYIPVILGKSSKTVFAVHGDVTVSKIEEYFKECNAYHKLVSTPEGLKKIIEAAKNLDIDIHGTFFLLIDECEKLIQDVSFRPRIVDAMEYFFKFKNRSFISATPIMPSDPRFKELGFRKFFIVPEVHVPINMSLYITNSLASTIKAYFNYVRSEHYLIFINSTERIASIINFLEIHSECQVFCSEESVDKLKIGGINSAQENFDAKKIKKYTFFTSRFFTAFDIRLEFKPQVLVVSDVIKVGHSSLDPNTDIIQIAGRPRNGISGLTHITNINGKLTSRSENEVREYLRGSQEAYLAIKELRDNSSKIGAYDVLNDALSSVQFAKFINPSDDSINHFMLDQEVFDNKIRGYYKSVANLIAAYESAEAYGKVKRYSLTVKTENYALDDDSIDKLKKGLPEKKIMEFVCESFYKGFNDPATQFSLSPNHALYQLIKTHQEKYKYYSALKIERIRSLEYSPPKIAKAYEEHLLLNSSGYQQLLTSLVPIFRRYEVATGDKIRKILGFYFRKYNINMRPTVTQLASWFEVDPNRRITLGHTDEGLEIKGYRIGPPKFFRQ